MPPPLNPPSTTTPPSDLKVCKYYLILLLILNCVFSGRKRVFLKNPDKCKEYYHPKLCNPLKNGQFCQRYHCKFYHLKGSQNQNSDYNQDPYYNCNYHYSGNNKYHYNNKTYQQQDFFQGNLQKTPDISHVMTLINNLSHPMQILTAEN